MVNEGTHSVVKLPNSKERPTSEIGLKSSSRPRLRPDIADALEDQNAQRVGRQMAEVEAAAKRRDQASEAAAAESGGEENYDIST